MSQPEDQKAKGGLGALGLGAIACVACCAGPLLAILGGVTIAGLAGTMLLGVASLVVAGAGAIAFFLVRQRRRAASCAVDAGPVAAPTFRPRTSDPQPAGWGRRG